MNPSDQAEQPDPPDLDYLLSGPPEVTPTIPPLPPTDLTSQPPQPQPPPVAPATAATATPANPKKRPLEDKKARDRKRVLRNRELARVSNERRKSRIKAMENELSETRQTVSTLEESIRCLEAENKELKNLLQGKSGTDATPSASLAVSQQPTSSAPQAVASNIAQTSAPQ